MLFRRKISVGRPAGWLATVCLLALACAEDITPPAAPRQADAVANGGFEVGRARPGDDALAGWSFPDTSSSQCEVVYDADGPHAGAACLTLKNVLAYGAVAQTLHSPFLAGRRVTVESYIKPTANEVAWVALTLDGDDFSPAPVFLPANRWSRVAYEVDIPAGGGEVAVVCYATATASFDDVRVLIPLNEQEEERLAGAAEYFHAGLAQLGGGPYPAEAVADFQRAAALLAGVGTYDALLAAQDFPYERWSVAAALVSDYGVPFADNRMEFDAGLYPGAGGEPHNPFHLTLDWEAGRYNRTWVYSDYDFSYEGLVRTTTFTHDVTPARVAFNFTADTPPGAHADVEGVLVGEPWLETRELSIEGKPYLVVALWCYALAGGEVSLAGADFGAGRGRFAPYYAQYGTGEPFLLGPK